MKSVKEASFDEIAQASLLISLFSGVDPETKYFENIPVLIGGAGLITDHQARLKVEESFGQLNLPDLFRTFDFTLHMSSYEPYKLKEDLVIAPYIYTVKAKHKNVFLMSLFLTPWADVNLSQLQEKISDFATIFSGIFRRTTEEINTAEKSIEYRHTECESGTSLLMRYLDHLVFDKRQMFGGIEKVSKPTSLLAVLFQRGQIGEYFACLGKCGNSFSVKTHPSLENCPNCGGKISEYPVRLFNSQSVSIAFPEGLPKAEIANNQNFNLHNPLDLIYLFQSSYLPNEIRITLNRIAENIFNYIVPLPHRALFEYRDSDDILTLYSLSKLEGNGILVISGIADSRPEVEGQLSQMALRLFIRDLNEGIKKGYSRKKMFQKSVLNQWKLSGWIPLEGEGPPETLTSWTNLLKTITEN